MRNVLSCCEDGVAVRLSVRHHGDAVRIGAGGDGEVSRGASGWAQVNPIERSVCVCVCVCMCV